MREPSATEDFVQQTREICGDSLPKGYLTADEYNVYTHLYGSATIVQDHDIEPFLDGLEKKDDLDVMRVDAIIENIEALYEPEYEDSHEPDIGEPEESQNVPNVLLRRNLDGSLEAVEYDSEPELDPETQRIVNEELQREEWPQPLSKRALEAMQDLREQGRLDPYGRAIELEEEYVPEGDEAEEAPKSAERLSAEKYLDELDEEAASQAPDLRTHPHTQEGRSGTNPSTIFLPKDTFVNPISSILSHTSNKHLTDFAYQTFGGRLMQDSVATPSTKGAFQQKPVALEATQAKMKTMEATTYLAAMMPGLYASITNILVEVRRRLGSAWIEQLLRQPNGPRILDIGGGGAGVLAWRDILRAEWERMHPDGILESVAHGQATVVSGAYELTSNVKQLLDNTTFVPRQPHFSPIRDIPGAREYDPNARKHYDIIIAPHTLWGLEEDYMRKNQVQNYWSLLNPDGGVLVLLEKGLPRGFEMVAGAREVLLNNHISSPGFESNSPPLYENSQYVRKEPGMIIAPCTNHSKCPMYTIPGEMANRKDFCHFQQRYDRPSFLRRLHGEVGKSHEDIRFSYIAVQRGKDKRQEKDIPQNEEATLAALEGYEDLDNVPEPLTLPRVVLPPMKRHKHVTFDLCTPSAQIERWTIPASKSKQGYRDARKARWGDLWALGAKTRVIRPVRSGTPKKTGKARKTIIEAGVGDTDDKSYLKEVRERPVGRKTKDGRKGRIWRQEREIKDEDL